MEDFYYIEYNNFSGCNRCECFKDYFKALKRKNDLINVCGYKENEIKFSCKWQKTI